MHKFLWVVQILLALHTAMGAFWKLTNTEQMVEMFSAIPHWAWLALCALELVCAVGLVLPAFNQRLAKFMPLAAAGIAAEMLLFCGLFLVAGKTTYSEMIYWLVVTAVSAFVAYGRLRLSPFPQHFITS